MRRAPTLALIVLMPFASAVRAEQSPQRIAEIIYGDHGGDMRKYMTKKLAAVENSVDPSWIYGGYYPDTPKTSFSARSVSAQEAEVDVRVFVDDVRLRRTLHFVRENGKWLVDHVSLVLPEGRAIP